MIKVTIGNNVKRESVIIDENTTLRSALEEHAVHVPVILGCFPEAEGGMYPGYLRNYGEAGFPKVHRGAESRVVVPLDGGGP